LPRLADELSIAIEVHHLPPGTSKLNKIEHRLFSSITQNWRAKLLVSYRVVVELIGDDRDTNWIDGSMRTRRQGLVAKLGPWSVVTTFSSYGTISPAREGEIFRRSSDKPVSPDVLLNADLLRQIADHIQQAGG
jgi:hypothetical protein